MEAYQEQTSPEPSDARFRTDLSALTQPVAVALGPAPAQVLALQRAAGNRATRRALARTLHERRSEPPRTRFLARQQVPQAAESPVRPVTIRWTGSIQSSLFDLLRGLGLADERAATVARAVLAQVTTYVHEGRSMAREEFERIPRSSFILDANLTDTLAREAGIDPARLRSQASVVGQVEEILGPIRAMLEGRTPPSREAREREAARWGGPRDPIQGSWAVLEGNEPLARVYLRLMEHYVGVPQTDPTRRASAGGLSQDELLAIVGTNETRRLYTNLFTQGWREFTEAAGADVAGFARLEERIFEQLAWGNPTAARNQLRIGYGAPESDVLGIVERSSRLLLYDAAGEPLRSFSGLMMRDYGCVAARRPGGAIELSIDDPALRLMFDMLRQQVADPGLTVVRGAQAYMDNMPLVNAAVIDGPPPLSKEVIDKFEAMLPMFLGFLAGHALSTFLMASANPVLAAIGAALKGLLVAAGYVMDMEFLGGAMERLMDAGYHLSRVVKNPDGRLTELSQHHLTEGARPIREMIADLAAMWLVRELGEVAGRSIGEALRNREVDRIECTRCSFKRRERRVRQRQAEANELLGTNQGWTRERIAGERTRIRERERATDPREVRHPDDASSHGVPTDVILETINNPDVTGLSANGSWVFYRRGTIVFTRPGDVNSVTTAYGRGGRVPARRVTDMNQLYPNQGPHGGRWEAGDLEPANTSWSELQSRPLSAAFRFVRIW